LQKEKLYNGSFLRISIAYLKDLIQPSHARSIPRCDLGKARLAPVLSATANHRMKPLPAIARYSTIEMPSVWGNFFDEFGRTHQK
jgi:hypothetical protein